jgi:phosphate transport system permease protein
LFRWGNDRALLWGLRGIAATSGVVLLLIAGFLWSESIPALRQLGLARFFSDPSWHPADVEAPTFDLRPAMMGTLLTAGGAIVLAGPLGILAAVFSRFYAPPVVGMIFRRIVELLAGIPSVVYGLWGLTVLVPAIADIKLPGTSLLAGMLILAVMILPTMVLLVDAAFQNVPREYFQAAAALGLSRWGTFAGVVFPITWPAMLTAALLSLARALGETMAVLMVSGNVVQFPSSVFDPIRTLTANMALEMGYALGIHRSALFVSGLLLTALVLGLVILSECLSSERPHV